MPNIEVPESIEAVPMGYVRELAPTLIDPIFALSEAVYRDTTLTLREFEAGRARMSQINGCRVCQRFRGASDIPSLFESMGADPTVGVHTRGPAPDEDFYSGLQDWREATIYSERERFVLEFVERYHGAPDALGSDGAFWNRARGIYTDKELVNLTIAAGYFVAAGRLVHVLGLDQGVCALVDQRAA